MQIIMETPPFGLFFPVEIRNSKNTPKVNAGSHTRIPKHYRKKLDTISLVVSVKWQAA